MPIHICNTCGEIYADEKTLVKHLETHQQLRLTQWGFDV